MPVLSAKQRRELMNKQAAVGMARNFERKPAEDCEKIDELKAKVEKEKKPPKPEAEQAEEKE